MSLGTFVAFCSNFNLRSPKAGLCSTHESWVKFDSTLTQMSRVRVESAVKIRDMSRVRVESCQSSLESSWINWILLESKLSHWFFWRESVKILHLSVMLPERNNLQLHSTAPSPPPRQQLLTKLGKMWWVVSQIWLNSDSNELSQSWVRLANLGFELGRCWVNQQKLSVESSQSWVTWIVTWVSVELARTIWVEHNPDPRSRSQIDLNRSSCLSLGASRRDEHFGAYPMSLSYSNQKL